MKLSISKMFLAIAVLGLWSCDNCDENRNDKGSKVELPNSRVFILNEGSYAMNNSGISFYSPVNDNYAPISDLYFQQNGYRIGDTALDMIEHRGNMYISVFGSNYVARLNSACVEEARISFATDADLQGGVRHLCASDDYVYATFYGGYVVKLKAADLSVVSKLHTSGANLEGIVLTGKTLYVANSYEIATDPSSGQVVYNYFDNLIKIDAATMTETGSVTVATNPNDMIVEGKSIFLLCYGNYADKGYQLQRIDLPTETVVNLAVATDMAVGNGKVYLLNSVTDWNTWLTTNTLFYYDISSGKVVNETFLKSTPSEIASGHINMMSVDKASGDIYIGVTHYTLSDGDMYRYKKEGTLVEMFESGGQNPTAVVFLN